MREAVGIPAGFLVYFLSTIILLLMVEIIFPQPGNWSYIITAVTAIISFKVTCIAVENFSTQAGVKIVGVLIAMFWLVSLGVDTFAGVRVIVDILSGGYSSGEAVESFKEMLSAVWNIKICAGVSLVLALWTLGR